jgi:hypothetical protein
LSESANFYSNAFGIQAPKRDDLGSSNALPDFLQKANQNRNNNNNKRGYNETGFN